MGIEAAVEYMLKMISDINSDHIMLYVLACFYFIEFIYP